MSPLPKLERPQESPANTGCNRKARRKPPLMNKLTSSWATAKVREFDSSGVHRIGTPGDRASGEWLLGEASIKGVTVARMPVFFERTIIDEAYVECAQERIEALPMFDAPATPANGIAGLLCHEGGDGQVAYVEFAPNAASIKGQPLEALRAVTRHSALVVATLSKSGALSPINAQHFSNPFGPSVLQVAGIHSTFFRRQAASNAPVKVYSAIRKARTESFNVAAFTPPLSSAQPLVIVTPRTGWWESTAERAGGILAWLASLEMAGKLQNEERLHRQVLAYATCGHELGHIGLDELIRQRDDLLKNARYWLHLGANLGTASSLQMMIRADNPDDGQFMRDLLIAEGYPAEFVVVEPMAKVSGEGHDLKKLGAKVLSMAGSNHYFHDAADRWPGNVNAAGIASISRAVARWVEHECGPQ
jgi:hypothetical protein